MQVARHHRWSCGRARPRAGRAGRSLRSPRPGSLRGGEHEPRGAQSRGRKARAGAQAAIRGDAAGHGPLAIEIQKRFVQFFMLSVGDGSSCRLVPLGN
ncbi:unnamed protein product [Symbiodinium natans]|uniref:Uncharacterized protein n=1 Tax=Symbiodinium natans TaxID=878477 RepID=A0A812SCQ1_9DINO|nr:unnamed protein product [Symbiodinium natans]